MANRTSIKEGRAKRKGKIGVEGAVTPSTLGCRIFKGKFQEEREKGLRKDT
jgi:hypothetical protein